MGMYNISIVTYADCVMLVADSEDNFQRLRYPFTESATELKFTTCICKTKCMRILL